MFLTIVAPRHTGLIHALFEKHNLHLTRTVHIVFGDPVTEVGMSHQDARDRPGLFTDLVDLVSSNPSIRFSCTN